VYCNTWVLITTILCLVLAYNLIHFKDQYTLLIFVASKAVSQPIAPSYSEKLLIIPLSILLLASFIPFMLGRLLKQNCSIDACRLIQKIMSSFRILIVLLCSVSTLQFVCCINNWRAGLFGSLLHFLWGGLLFLIAFKMNLQAKDCNAHLQEFHDYLVSYK
jgi:hypothetical protein